jgi:hypothetical protein
MPEHEISATNADRGRNNPTRAHQINLQKSLIERTIYRFAGVSHGSGFAVGMHHTRKRVRMLGLTVPYNLLALRSNKD